MNARGACLRLRGSCTGFRAKGQRTPSPCCHAVVTPAPATTSQSLWSEFAKHASGEWEGVTATFGPAGEPQPLPDNVVPGAFKEWDVVLYDWQSQCSSLAAVDANDGGGGGTLTHRVRRMLPIVGCEADAVTYAEDVRTLWSQDPSASPKGLTVQTVSSDGGYFAGPASLPEDKSAATLEVCFMQPGVTPAARTRLLLHVAKGPAGDWQAARYEIHTERFEAPYQGGITQLLACGGELESFAQNVVTRAADASSRGWHTMSGVCYSSDGRAAWSADRPHPLQLDGHPSASLTPLPLGLWARFFTSPAVDGKGAEVHIEAGSVHEQQHSRRSRVRVAYVDSLLTSCELLEEEKK